MSREVLECVGRFWNVAESNSMCRNVLDSGPVQCEMGSVLMRE